MKSHRMNRTSKCFRPGVESLESRCLLSASAAGVDVLTYHNDNSRTGANLNETTLTPQNVNASSFGKLFSYKVDGDVYAQTLEVSQVRMNDGQVHNVLIVATENDSVYAFDANDPTAGPRHDGVLWQDSFINPAKGITPVPSQDEDTNGIFPTFGITGTPVIDKSTNTIYVVSVVKEQPTSAGGPHYVMQFHALNLINGKEKNGGPVTIGDTTLHPDGTFTNNTPVSVPGTGAGSANGVVAFNALRELNRPGLVLDMQVPGHPDGVVFAGFADEGDVQPYHGWLVGFDAKTSKLVTLFNTDPNGDFGGIWQGGAAPSVASNGDLILGSGNGTFDAFTTTTPPGAAAQGEGGFGLGFGGIHQSAAVSFAASIPSDGVSSTGLFFNGDYPTDKPLAPDVNQPLAGTGINFAAGAEDPNGPHTYQATLSYHGTTLSETITDQTTGASFSRNYANVNLPTSVGGKTAFVGFGAGTDGRVATIAIKSWTYTSGGTTLINHSGGFASNGDVTATGITTFNGSEADLTDGGGQEAGNLFANVPVNVQDFTTTFTFQMRPDTGSPPAPVGDGLTFIIQNDTGHKPGPDFGESSLRLSPTPGTMTVVDSFTPFDFKNRNIHDTDTSSTSMTLLPAFPGTAHPNLAVTADKSGTIRLIDLDNMGGFNAGGPDRVIQEFVTDTHGPIYSSPVYFDGKIYIQGTGDVIKAFALELDPATNTMMLNETPVTEGTIVSGFPGEVQSVSANGNTNGIVWSAEVDNSNGPAILRAYDANNLSTPLYASNQAGPRDTAGDGLKFSTPTIANGHVYLGEQFEVDVYGLLGQSPAPGKGQQGSFLQTDLVSNVQGMAATFDPSLVNPWGLSASGTSPFWVSDNNTGLSTLYNGQGMKVPLTVTIPAATAGAQGTPTGTVANPVSNGFEVTKVVNGKPVTAAPAFLFATLDGTISGWSPNLDPNNAPTDDVIAVTNPNEVYTGLTLDATTGLPPRLYAADWSGNTVDVFDQNFKPVDKGAFQDPKIPSDFHVFNVQDLNGLIYVTYAKFDPATGVDASGPGNGFVDVFSRDGVLLNHLISHDHLDSPWGLAIAPAGFGSFGGDLLVGNFGDGTIHAYDPNNGHFEGTLRDAAGKPIQIENLWALRFGNNAGSGSSNTLFFTAGVIDDPATPFGASAGLLGSLQAIPSTSPQAAVMPNRGQAALQSSSTVPANGDLRAGTDHGAVDGVFRLLGIGAIRHRHQGDSWGPDDSGAV